MEIKVNANSVTKEHGIYMELSSGSILAITYLERKKIEAAHQKYQEQNKIPDELTVQARLLGKNKNGVYEDGSGVLHQYKIKDLKFAASKIEWVE